MSLFHSNSLIGASGQGGGGGGAYTIDRSVRFNSADSAYLNRTPSSAGNRKTWTWSGWVKKTEIGTASNRYLLNALSGSARSSIILLGSGDQLQVDTWNGSSYSFQLVTTQVFRDPSAWYHLVVSVDTTDGTTSNRVKIYVNGSQITSFDTASYPSPSLDTYVNLNTAHYLGAYDASNNHLNGYLADVHFIDGQALDPTDFGEFDATTGAWNPIAYSGGSYGTNGFHLDFSDNSSASALGTDSSGNGNNWTVSNLSVTAGAGNDSLFDSPTNGTQTDTGAGGEVSGGYATLNPLFQSGTYSNGNLDLTTTAGNKHYRGTIGVSSGKWYWEVTPTGGTTPGLVALVNDSAPATQNANQTGGYAYYSVTGNKQTSGVDTSYGATYTYNDVIGVAFDADNGTLTFYKNGTSQGTAFTGLTDGPYFPACSAGSKSNTTNFVFNAGQRAWAYSAPTGYQPLTTALLDDPTITDPSTVMDVLLWTGTSTSSARTISGLQFSPDLVWAKSRSLAYSNNLYDTVRGTGKGLYSDSLGAESTNNPFGYISAFTSDGFTGTPGSTDNGFFNETSATYAAWCWDAGSSTVSNTDGSITSSVRANASAGFSIVTWTGTGSSATIGHGLNATPGLILCKDRGSNNWVTQHAPLGQQYLVLNLTLGAGTDSNIWNAASTSSTFSVGSGSNVNGSSRTYVAYCFAPVSQYSAFGSYTGNGSTDGTFVYTGFRPAFVMLKSSSTGGYHWIIEDYKINNYNATGGFLKANRPSSEDSGGFVDFLSNGFKPRLTSANFNGSGITYIYAAFAESPFKYARAK